MRRTISLAALLAALLVSLASVAFAFEPPGLTADANRYFGEIRRLAPAGGNPQQRADADRRLRDRLRPTDDDEPAPGIEPAPA